MARRHKTQRSSRGQLFHAVLVLGALSAVGKLLSPDVIDALGRTVGIAVVVLVSAATLLCCYKIYRKFAAQRRVDSIVAAEMERHRDTLVRKRAQLIYVTPNGVERFERWNKEIEDFIDDVIAYQLNDLERAVLFDKRRELINRVERLTREAQETNPILQSFSANMTAAEFEEFCARELQQAGWLARLTKGSGDQGVDVVAEKDGIKVAVQCKLYSQPVGNKAVQEVAAGQRFWDARYAIVVSNRSYTKAARQLADSNSVLLLHYSELRGIAWLLGRSENYGRTEEALGDNSISPLSN